MISSSSSSSYIGVSSCLVNQSHAKKPPPHNNSSDFNAVGFVSSFLTTFAPSFQFFSKSFLIFNKFASETITVFAVISFPVTFS